MDISPILVSIQQWVETLTFPGILFAALAFQRWLIRKEQLAQTAFAGLVASINNLKDNHLAHLQESLDGIKTAQLDLAKQLSESTREIVASQNASKDAIVSAIIASGK